MIEFLSDLKKHGIPAAIVTSSGPDSEALFKGNQEFASYFDAVVTRIRDASRSIPARLTRVALKAVAMARFSERTERNAIVFSLDENKYSARYHRRDLALPVNVKFRSDNRFKSILIVGRGTVYSLSPLVYYSLSRYENICHPCLADAIHSEIAVDNINATPSYSFKMVRGWLPHR